ncbi:hypothetical protein HPP92_014199 [Vanilla planifolia]|uniref:Uncharacterized protein n=1 Tax=Vanilla planifolia TaxID=51239 RepID=A0A835QT35_VANPL|nr:hypothetical protein HPP92_014199 [Vanilla planifolia]
MESRQAGRHERGIHDGRENSQYGEKTDGKKSTTCEREGQKMRRRRSATATAQGKNRTREREMPASSAAQNDKSNEIRRKARGEHLVAKQKRMGKKISNSLWFKTFY